ncbi:uncharacterized protein [Littorina saxatilis]|uniref:EF-hand domain-containing protein n=1 Tax=Littorina saxatilis TaxID=31220 RepID=A0AAN9ARG6_9CAEN
MTEEQLKGIKASFSKIDKNSDGRISVTELMRAQQALGANPTRKEVAKMIKEVDDNDSGFIELNEYIELMSEKVGMLEYQKQQMKAAFHHVDKDGSGKLSRDELRQFLTSHYGEPLTEDEFNYVMGDMDQDGDGQIDIDEFCNLLCQHQGT